jgi:DNA-binding MarR family transcriptional regulator/GNAT superfamily N-acetyltransferase
MYDTDHSLAEGRVLFELGQVGSMERQELRERLNMDPSYLTRVLRRLERKGLLVSGTSPEDRRARVLALTEKGRESFTFINQRSTDQVEDLLAPLAKNQQDVLTESAAVMTQLVSTDRRKRNVVLRAIRPGDLGWVVSRNGAIYADQFGWDTSFEALVARVLADFHTGFKPGRENGWIAEVDGARAGCVFCVERDGETAQLRVLLVEPWARGEGLGRRLVDECIEFARGAGYSKMMLWTVGRLTSARRIYKGAGFELVEEQPLEQFGFPMVDEIWEMDLTKEMNAADC